MFPRPFARSCRTPCSRFRNAVAALIRGQTELQFEPKQLYREPCEDAEGNRYTVIVWCLYPGLARTDSPLADGSPVTFVDDCVFQDVDSDVNHPLPMRRP